MQSCHQSAENKAALWEALLDDRLDVIATDHAPHLLKKSSHPYEKAHAGLPLVQHPLRSCFIIINWER